MKECLAMLLVITLSGCTTTDQVREEASARLDAAEAQIRDLRISYSQRMDRVSLSWICSGMSWASLVKLTKGNMQLVDAIMQGCREEVFPLMQPADLPVGEVN